MPNIRAKMYTLKTGFPIWWYNCVLSNEWMPTEIIDTGVENLYIVHAIPIDGPEIPAYRFSCAVILFKYNSGNTPEIVLNEYTKDQLADALINVAQIICHYTDEMSIFDILSSI